MKGQEEIIHNGVTVAVVGSAIKLTLTWPSGHSESMFIPLDDAYRLAHLLLSSARILRTRLRYTS